MRDEGRRAARAFYYSPQYAWLDRDITPEDAARLFLPPVNESQTQISMPLPKDRQEWLEGFREELEKLKCKK